MRAFAYTAYTDGGRRRRGTVVAETEADASARLSAQGLHVARLHAAARPAARARAGRLAPEIRAVFTRQMAVLLEAGLPVDATLEAVRSGGHPALDGVGARARAQLMDGAPLAEALAASGAGFPPYMIAAIRAGEGAGQLPAVFSALADHLEAQGSDRAQLATALIYPAFVAAVSILVCAVLMVTVAPEIVALYAATDQPLPGLSRAVLAAADWIGAHAVALALAGAGLVVFGFTVPRVAALQALRDRITLRLPVVGRLVRLQAAVQYLRTLALVFGARDAAVAALDNAVAVLGPADFRADAEAAAQALRRGESLSDALARVRFLPPVALSLVRAGEASAQVAPMTARAADMAVHRLTTERRRLAALLEPALMMLVGGMVLVIVLAVLLPIFDLQAGIAP